MKERTWAEIDIDALKFNIRGIRRITDPKARVMAVVKADAYGHGAKQVAGILLENGADMLAVATVEEGIELRGHGITAEILCLGAIADDFLYEAVRYDIIPSIFCVEGAKKASEAGAAQNKDVKIYIALDTGMSRIGFVAGRNDDEVAEDISKIAAMPHISIEGIFSHFTTADETDQAYTDIQFERFMSVCGAVEKRGIYIPVKSIANSAAIMMRPEYHLDMVRAGIILYGCYPSEEVDKTRLELKRVMSIKSRITRVERPGGGRGVSYGNEYITDDSTVIATVPIGYADGYTRLYKNKAYMAVGGEKVPVVGRICMDQCMIEVTNVHNINAGDEVTVFGTDIVTADDLAGWMGTINYEVLCMTAGRVPRIYIENGRIIKEVNYLLQSAAVKGD